MADIVTKLLDNLAKTVSSQANSGELRQQIGKMRARYKIMLNDGTFYTELLKCFTLAQAANVILTSLVNVRQQLLLEDLTDPIMQAALVFCLSTESRMITDIEFISRDDVQTMINRMRDAFDTARDILADGVDSLAYQQFNALAGALIQHLAAVARPLPRMITFNVVKVFPAMVISNLIYFDPSRWDEIILENKVVHPLFMPRELVGLSS